MSLGDPGLALVLDPGRLSDLVGREVGATHLRPKPGVSTVAALVDGEGMPWGWVRTLTGEAVAKAGKARQRAAEVGLAHRLGEAGLGGRDTLVQWGPLATDPRLARALARLDLAQVQVLRHNPLRRVVGRLRAPDRLRDPDQVRDHDLVVRVTDADHRDRLTRLSRALAAGGVPVTTPLGAVPEGLPQGRGVTWWPWVEGADASTLDPAGAGAGDVLHAVGQAVGGLHAVDPSSVPDLPTRGWAQVRAAATSSVELLEAVSPGTAASARRVLDRLPRHAPDGGGGGGAVVCHGDLSLDQVLLRPGGEPLLTDLDRAVLAPAVLDHATFAAVDLVEGRGSLGPVGDGYAAATGRRPAAPGPWVAAVLLARVAEPWRRQVPGWSGESVRRALLAGQALVTDDVWSRPARELAVIR